LYSKNCISKDKTEIDKLLTFLLYIQDTLSQEFEGIQKMNDDEGLMNNLKDVSTWNRLSKQFKMFTEKVTKGAQKIAFNIYGTPVDFYVKALIDMFKEVYFVELWIVDL
jgi:hypothetical protein